MRSSLAALTNLGGYDSALCVLPHDGVTRDNVTGHRFEDHLYMHVWEGHYASAVKGSFFGKLIQASTITALWECSVSGRHQ